MNIPKANTESNASPKKYIETSPLDLMTVAKRLEAAARNARHGEMVEYEIIPGLVFLYNPQVSYMKDPTKL